MIRLNLLTLLFRALFEVVKVRFWMREIGFDLGFGPGGDGLRDYITI